MAFKCDYAGELKARFADHKGVIGASCLGCANGDCRFQRSADWQWSPEEVAMLKALEIPEKEGSVE